MDTFFFSYKSILLNTTLPNLDSLHFYNLAFMNGKAKQSLDLMKTMNTASPRIHV